MFSGSSLTYNGLTYNGNNRSSNTDICNSSHEVFPKLKNRFSVPTMNFRNQSAVLWEKRTALRFLRRIVYRQYKKLSTN